MPATNQFRATGSAGVAERSSHAVGAFALILIFLHFQFFKVSGFPVTAAPLFLLWFFVRFYHLALTPYAWVCVFLAMFYPLLPLWDSPVRIQMADFFKTYALWILNFLLLWFAFRAPLRARAEGLPRAAYIVVWSITLFSALQSGYATLTGSPLLYSPFGPFQYLYHQDPDLMMAATIARAPVFYLEPSFAAQVIITAGGICLLAGYRPAIVKLLLVISMAFIGSRGGWLVVLALLALNYVVTVRPVILIQVALAGLALGLAASPLLVSLVLSGNTVVNFNMDAFEAEGTSEFLRIVLGPIIIARELPQHLLGLPFGSMELIVEKHFGVRLPFFSNLYVGVYYFGIVAIMSIFVFVGHAVDALLRRSYPKSMFCLLFATSLFISGSLLNPETTLLVVLAVYQYRLIVEQERFALLKTSGGSF